MLSLACFIDSPKEMETNDVFCDRLLTVFLDTTLIHPLTLLPFYVLMMDRSVLSGLTKQK